MSANLGKPLCSVVIVTWNRRDDLSRLLPSLFEQSIADQLEVIIVDNASTDDTVAWLDTTYGAKVRVLRYDVNRGASTGRNAGILAARAPYVCFVDSDAVLLSNDAIAACIGYLKTSSSKQAVATSIWFDREMTRPFLKGGYTTPDGHYDGIRSRSETENPTFLSTCFAVWRRDALVALRGFDPWFFWGMEDVDLCLRAWWPVWKSRRESPFGVLENYHGWHNMSGSGRHHDPQHFEATFRRVERERLYMVLSYGGLFEFFRVMLRGPFRMKRIQRAWETPLTMGQKFRSVIGYPLVRLFSLPKHLIDVRKDFLKETPAADEVMRRG